MAYPLMNHYNDVIQNPRLCLNDEELKKCQVEINQLGLPKVASGGFALTYKLSHSNRSWAVRCFHKEIPDLQQRYERISSFLKSSQSKYFTSFDYINNGIAVNSSRFPIVKMDWLNGTPLNLYIEKNINNHSLLDKLILNFQNCLHELEKLGVAHGDLQHGNILIVNDEIKLIDYDGMFVPNAGFSKSNELGHVNYQHPLRDEMQYGNHLDRFSGIVICLAIQAVKAAPHLWAKYDTGENLLFQRQDFVNPENSSLLSSLRSISSLSSHVENFIKVCKAKIDKVPTFSQFFSGNISISESDYYSVRAENIVKRRQYKLIDASNTSGLLAYIGDVVEVVGQVQDVYIGTTRYNQKFAMLNFGNYKGQSFRIPIWQEGLKLLSQKSQDVNSYEKKWVSIIGLLTSYKGAPQIQLDGSVRIHVLSNSFEATELLKETTYEVGLNNKAGGSRNTDILKNITGSTNYKEHPIVGGSNPNHVRPKVYNSPTLIGTGQQQNPITNNQKILESIQNQSASQKQNHPTNSGTRNQTSKSSSSSQHTGNSNCFIATEVYGDNNALEVQKLRLWRDEFLSQTRLGNLFIDWYYKISPSLVTHIKNKNRVKAILRHLLSSFIRVFIGE